MFFRFFFTTYKENKIQTIHQIFLLFFSILVTKKYVFNKNLEQRAKNQSPRCNSCNREIV